ncbi:MAG: hypothetical protein IT383_01325 [Deltaproteobacteria bacterium]|nr:hypothetical protein [Deltaproteobacteria bacterium]
MKTTMELVLNFRRALIALIPHVECLGIPWRDDEKYDEWESLASALFETLVIFPIRTSLDEREWADVKFAPYEILQEDYALLSVLIMSPSTTELRVFYGLATTREPFDTCLWYRVSAGGQVVSRTREATPLAETNLAALVRTRTGVRVLSDVLAPASH